MALGASIYFSIRHQILSEFDERITEETDALNKVFQEKGRDRLVEIIQARGSSGGSLDYGLVSPEGKQLAGDLQTPVGTDARERGGWTELSERDGDEEPERP
jgi:hypothetical protein